MTRRLKWLKQSFGFKDNPGHGLLFEQYELDRAKVMPLRL